MAQFYAEIKGCAKTTATRRGTKTTGIFSHTRGWTSGVKVNLCHLGHSGPQKKQDHITITLTSGSNGGPERELFSGTETELINLLTGGCGISIRHDGYGGEDLT